MSRKMSGALLAVAMAAGTWAMVGDVRSVAAVEANGVITGTVTDGTNPVAGALVTASPLNGLSGPGAGGNTIAAANGTYALSGLLPGQYAVGFDGPVGSPFIGEFWQNKYFEQANPVTVTEGATTPGIDAALDLGGSISGRVTGPGGVPLRDVLVSVALDPPNPGIGFSGSDLTDDDGRRQVCGVLAVTALARVRRDLGPPHGMAMRTLLADLDLATVAGLGEESRDVDTWADLRDLTTQPATHMAADTCTEQANDERLAE